MTGYFFAINQGTISWQTCKQPSVATSSTQAEYMALSTTAKEVIWIRELLKKLDLLSGCTDPMLNSMLNSMPANPTLIYQDNQSMIALAHNPINHSRMKHIDIQHHYIRECIERGAIRLEYLSTERMAADVLTKPLPAAKYKECIQCMGIQYIGIMNVMNGNQQTATSA